MKKYYINLIGLLFICLQVSAQDIGYSSFDSPDPNQPLYKGTKYSIKLGLQNFGTTDVNYADMQWGLRIGKNIGYDNGIMGSTDKLAAGSSVTITILLDYEITDISSGYSYAYTRLAGDKNLNNDTTKVTYVMAPTGIVDVNAPIPYEWAFDASQNLITVQSHGNECNASFQIYDIAGNMAMSFPNEIGDQNINIANLAQGTYIGTLQYRNSDGFYIVTKKFIK